MRTAQRITFFTLALVLNVLTCAGQDFFDVAKASSDLYDNRGFLKGKATNWHGSVNVSMTNGNVQYRYDLSNTTYNGIPINVSLNFNQNASYTSYLKYNPPVQGVAESGKYTTFTQNRPVWMVGVNGFAVQALHAARMPIQSKAVRDAAAQITSYTGLGIGGNHQFTDEHVTWLLDGYDVCTVGEVIYNPSHVVTDVIRILKEDGSIMELVQTSGKYCGPTTPTAEVVTGVYMEKAANSRAYAIVTYDESAQYELKSHKDYLIDNNVLEEERALYRPRVCKYYPGDGTAYVFMEWRTPFGLRPIKQLPFDDEPVEYGLGDWRGSMSVFYLERIEQFGHTILEFDRSKHKNLIVGRGDLGVPFFGEDVSPGRATFLGFEGHQFFWSDQGFKVNVDGKITEVMFDNVIKSGRGNADTKLIPFCPVGSQGDPLTVEPEWIEGQDKFMSYVGLVTSITDPVGRVTTFDYENTSRTIEKTKYPFGRFPNTQQEFSLKLSGKRLTKITEYDKRTDISYLNAADQEPFEYATMGATNGAPDPRSVQIAQSVTVYNSEDQPQHETVYAIGSGSSFSPGQDRLVSTADHWDLVEDPAKSNSSLKTSETFEYKSIDPLFGLNLTGTVNVGRFTELTRRVNTADGVTTTTHRTYAALTDGTNSSYIYMPAMELTTKTFIGQNQSPVTVDQARKLYTYEVENVYDGVGGLAEMLPVYVHAFGLRPTKQTELLSVSNGTAFVDNLLTETYFRNVKSTTSSYTYTRKDWMRIASQQLFLAALQAGTVQWDDWNTAKGDESWNVYDTKTLTSDVQVTPHWGIVTKTLSKDPVSLQIQGGTEYEFNEDPFSSSGYYDYALLKPVKTYRILRGGSRELVGEVAYAPSLNRSFPETSTDALGATSKAFVTAYTVPNGRTDVTGDGKREVSILTDNPSAREVKPKQIEFLTKHARFFETPYATQQFVRKADPSAPLGALTTDVLCSHSKIGVSGVVTDAVDDNGWLTSSIHDDMGRVRMLWMPGDFMSENWDPQLNGESLALVSAGTRRVDGFPMSRRILYTYLYECPEVPGEELEEEPYQTPETTYVAETYVGWQVMDPPRDKCATTNRIAPRDPSDAPLKGTSEQTTQQYIGGEPPNGWAPNPWLYYKKEYLTTVSLDVPRWEYKTVTSAKLHVKVANVVGNSVGVTFKFNDHNTFVQNVFGADAVSPTVTPSEVTEYILDLGADLAAFQASTGTGPQQSQFVFTFSPELISENEAQQTAYVQIVSAQLVVTGEFRTWENFSSFTDFTLAFGVDDRNRFANRFVKIDDSRSRVVPYPAGYTLPWRLAPSYTKLGVDDITLEERSNYPIHTLNPGAANAGSTTSFSFNGKSNTKAVTDPKGNVTTFSFDAQGRPLTTNFPTYDLTTAGNGCFQFLQASAQKIDQSYSVAPKSSTPFVDAYQITDIYGRDDLTSNSLLALTVATNETGKISLQVVDAWGRLRRTVENYKPSVYPADPFQTTSTDENVTTLYDYDIAGRIVRVTNPKGQKTLYWYNNVGGVRYSFQPDVGALSYAYDKLGHVRFSQNDAQVAERKLSFFQYDDLGRITSVGEATIDTNLLETPVSIRSNAQVPYNPEFNAHRFTDEIDPNVLAISQTVSGQDLKLVTVNRTLWQQPAAAVPKVWNNGAETVVAACPPLLIAGNDTKFNPRVVPVLNSDVLYHPAIKYNRVVHASSPANFEDAQAHPSNYLTVVQYDALPPSQGVAWGGFPAASTWNAIAGSPTGAVRNLRGRIASIAYRGHGFQPFHYVVKSYDERGRLEALLRYTENVGFDAVYYSYNSMNAVTRMRIVDPLKQHYTWYTYDDQGRQSTMRSLVVDGGFGVGAQPVLPAELTDIPFSPGTSVTLAPDEQFIYNERNELVSTILTGPVKRVNRTYNQRGWVTSITAKDELPFNPKLPEFQQHLKYNAAGLIESQCWSRSGVMANETYIYDELQRLNVYTGSNGMNTYEYDLVGNRLNDLTGGTARAYAHGGAALQPNALVSVTGATHNAQFTYDAHGALTLRSMKEFTPQTATSKIEEFSYDASGLIERYQVRKAAGQGGQSVECAPDASMSPRSDWRYRFGPMKEREQKRLYLSDQGPNASLPWVYYLLSPSSQQLAVYNGIEGRPCGGAMGNVYLWPVEYNAYGVGGGRVITRPDNTKRFVVTDHLGSVRLTYDAQGVVLETADYEPFGTVVAKAGEEARTGYIGRETDNESNLGFNGVRLYDQQYGRFLSTDAMWEKFHATQAYHYCTNSPVQLKDDDGESPTMIVGALIGASVDLFVQTVIEGKSMSGDNGNTVDWGRVGLAGLTGALTGGVSSMTTSVIGRAGLVGAASTVGGWAQRSHAHEKTTTKDVVVDATVGAVTSLVTSGLSSLAKQTADGLAVKNELRRATNILENGRVRTGFVNHVNSLNEKYNNLGMGPANSFLVELMGGIASSKPSKPAKTNSSNSGSKGGVPVLLERPK